MRLSKESCRVNDFGHENDEKELAEMKMKQKDQRLLFWYPASHIRNNADVRDYSGATRSLLHLTPFSIP